MGVIVRFDLISAYMAGEKEHPQKVMKQLGCTVLAFEGAPIGDCCFMEIDHLPNPLPNYITITDWEFTKMK